MNDNYLFDTDAYKPSHAFQFPPNTTSMFSYIESRGGVYEATVFFALQYAMKAFLTWRVKPEDVEEAKTFYAGMGVPFDYDGWMYIANELQGKLPIRIRSVPEGSLIPTHNILVSIESTDPKVFWIVSWLETMLLRYVWYGTNVATISHHIKQIILNAKNKSSDNPQAEIGFSLHDFGSRGVSSQESAMIGGAAHLINFMGSDTVVGVRCATKYYHAKNHAFSIPAMEHSTVCSYGKEHEVEAYRNMLNQFAKPGAILAMVSDSYDLWNACEHIFGEQLKEQIVQSGATIVIRPDSGNPPDVVLKVAQILESKFGTTVNSKGYRVLNHVRIIQGDGINEHSIKEILNNLLAHGFSATNITFGMGGALLQQHNRDSQKFAQKCSSVVVNGEERDVFKDPITDPGKTSKKGRLDLIRNDQGQIETIKLIPGQLSHPQSIMRTVYENGELLIDEDFETVRTRANSQIKGE